MKKLLYVIVGLLALYIILCLFGPAETKVERSIEIDAPAELVKAKIPDLKFFHDHWSPWTEKDPKMKVTYTGETGEEGSSMAWVSNVKEVGKGSMTYNYTHGDTVMQTLHFDDYGDSKVYHVVKANGNKSKVTWIMQSKNPFMARAMMLFMNMDKMIGPDFEKGLKSLKLAIETMGTAPETDFDINEISWEPKTYFGKKEKLSFDKMQAFFGDTYGKLMKSLEKSKITPIGAPKAIYFSFDEKTMVSEVAAVMELAKNAKLADFDQFETPGGKVLHIAYYGAYENSAAAHYAMDAYMKANGLTQVSVIEEYVTDPMTEKDPNKWLTNIYYVVK